MTLLLVLVVMLVILLVLLLLLIVFTLLVNILSLPIAILLLIIIIIVIMMQVKRDLLRRVSRVVDRDVVIASSSLRLPLDKVPVHYLGNYPHHRRHYHLHDLGHHHSRCIEKKTRSSFL